MIKKLKIKFKNLLKIFLDDKKRAKNLFFEKFLKFGKVL